MGTYWANFARDGVPYADGFDQWPPYEDGESLLYLDSSNDGGIRVKAGGDSLEKLLADLTADSRINQEQKCTIVASLTDFNRNTEVDPSDALGCPAELDQIAALD